MRVEPQQLDFTPPQPRDQSVTVFNEGDAPFVIGPVRMQSGDNAYFHDSPPCLSQPLASKERCTIPVHYNAGLTGTAQTHVADLLISPDSMPGARVRLTWTRPLEPAVSASPSSLSFGRVRLGAEATQDVTFTNTGGGAANNVVVGFMKDNTPFSVARNGCSSLPANSRCVVSVRFRPTGAGHANATLTFWNGLAMLTTVAVDGDGLPSPNDPVVQ
jgi:hypothetical protein